RRPHGRGAALGVRGVHAEPRPGGQPHRRRAPGRPDQPGRPAPGGGALVDLAPRAALVHGPGVRRAAPVRLLHQPRRSGARAGRPRGSAPGVRGVLRARRGAARPAGSGDLRAKPARSDDRLVLAPPRALRAAPHAAPISPRARPRVRGPAPALRAVRRGRDPGGPPARSRAARAGGQPLPAGAPRPPAPLAGALDVCARRRRSPLRRIGPRARPLRHHPDPHARPLVRAAAAPRRPEVPVMTRPHPVSTYRLQMRGELGFAAATEHVAYLHALGIEWLYASPLLRAASGSTHGYDVVDPTMLDPALGSPEDFEALVAALHEAGMGLLLDVVPNPMRAALGSPWWRDQLGHGPASRYTGFFDIRWSMDPQARLVLPTLERHYGEVLEQGLLRLGIDELGLLVRYHDRAFPLDPHTWPQVLDRLSGPPGVHELSQACRALPPRIDAPAVRQRRAEQTPHLRRQLAALLREHPGLSDEIAAQPQGDVRERCDALHALLEAQAYRLAY